MKIKRFLKPGEVGFRGPRGIYYASYTQEKEHATEK
jgi:hypothetical protein